MDFKLIKLIKDNRHRLVFSGYFSSGSSNYSRKYCEGVRFETHLKLSELAKLNKNEIKFIPPTELVCNLYLLIREDLRLG